MQHLYSSNGGNFPLGAMPSQVGEIFTSPHLCLTDLASPKFSCLPGVFLSAFHVADALGLTSPLASLPS